MSDAVYPVLPGLSWPVKRTPVWNTRVQTSASGREWRLSMMNTPRYRYVLPYEFLRNEAAFAEYQTLFGFFNARRGSYDTFLFDDLGDNTVSEQPFATANGTTAQFPLVRTFGGFTEPIGASKGPVDLFINGVAVNLLPNASMEFDSDADGLADGWSLYSAGTTGTVSVSRVTGLYGGYAQQVACSNLSTSTSDLALVYADVADVSARVGTPLTTRCTWKVSAACTLQLWLEFYTGSGTFISQSVHVSVSATVSGSWQALLNAGVIVPVGAKVARCVIAMSARVAAPGACAMSIDAVEITPGLVSQASYSPITASVSNGVVTFSQAPAASAALSWTGSYYWRTRFDTDELTFEQFMQQFWRTGEVRLITVKP